MRHKCVCVLAAWLVTGCSGNPDVDRSLETTAELASESGFVDVRAGRLYYEIAGAGDHVVLIHGNTGDRRHWDLQFETLAKHYRVLRYDVRGYGRSSVPLVGEAYTDFDDLSAILDSLQIGSAHIVGWSMGSGIAIDFGLAHPEKVQSLITVGPWINGYSSPGAMEMFEGMGQVVTAMTEGGPEAATDALMNAEFMRKTIRDSTAAQLFESVAREYSYWGFANPSPQVGLEPGALERLSDITAPMLVIAGEFEVVGCLEIAELLDRTVPDSRIATIGGTGHMMQLEKPDQVNGAILDFLAGVDSIALTDFPVLRGEYFGQQKPGRRAEPFGTRMLATRQAHYVRSITFSADGHEAYWPVIDLGDDYRRWIMSSRTDNNVWTKPRVIGFSNRAYHDDVPSMSPSGNKMLFLSRRPVVAGDTSAKENIWLATRAGEIWSEPTPLPGTVNSLGTLHQRISLDREDNLYFGCEAPEGHGSLDIYFSPYENGEHRQPVNLGPVVNGPEAEYAPFISPDGDYLLFTKNVEDGWSVFLTFPAPGGSWTPPIDVKNRIEGLDGMDLDGAFVTRDGRWLIFFGEQGQTATPYWTDASIIETLRAELPDVGSGQ